MLEGLLGGLCTLQPHLSPTAVNHLLLLTDAHTYGDEDRCLLLAKLAAQQAAAVGVIESRSIVFQNLAKGYASGIDLSLAYQVPALPMAIGL